MFDSKGIIDKVFELYKPIFRETDSMPEFNKYKSDFSRKFSSKIEDMFDMMSSKKADKDDVVDFIQKNIKDYLPYSESIEESSTQDELNDITNKIEKIQSLLISTRKEMENLFKIQKEEALRIDHIIKTVKDSDKRRDFLEDEFIKQATTRGKIES